MVGNCTKYNLKCIDTERVKDSVRNKDTLNITKAKLC